MALLLKKDTQFGNTVEYWKICQVNIDWLNKNSNIVLLGFINEAARKAGKVAIASQSFGYNGTIFPFTVDGNNIKQAYLKIKESYQVNGVEQNEWAKALDI